MQPTHVALLTALLLLSTRPSWAQNDASCVNPRGERGNCQSIRSCEPLLRLLRTYGNQAGDFLRESVCGYDGQDPRVCCPNGDNGSRNTDQPNPNENGGAQANPRYGPLLAPQCGTTGVKFTRVVGGVPAKLGAWPWIAVLGYRGKQNPNKPRWLCGGSLISARHVLTAGHCVYNRDDLFMVRLGDLDLESNTDGATPMDIAIENRTIHPEYSPNRYTNDIAVLRLDRDVEFTPLIMPICLPVTENIKQKNLVGAFPFLVGWGSVYFNGPSSAHLQQLQVPVVSPDDCKYAFRNFKTATIDDRVMCAGYAKGGKDACQGDSGGPLMYPIGKTFYAVGVVSYGFRCAEPGFPGVYTKTTSFLDFVLPLLN